MLEGGNTVIALVDIEVVLKLNGKRLSEEDEVQIWHFNDEGKVNKFRPRADTLRHCELITKPVTGRVPLEEQNTAMV